MQTVTVAIMRKTLVQNNGWNGSLMIMERVYRC